MFIKRDDYRHLQVERDTLVEVMDSVLKSFANLDRNKPLNDAYNAFYFWDAIGTMKGELNWCGVKDKEDWIEP